MGTVSLVEPVLPLHHHAEVLVVEEQHLDGDVFTVAGGELLDVHEDAAVSIDVDNERLWMGDLGPHRRRQSESHRAQATRGEPRPGATELVELCRPHLVLAHADRDDRVAFGREP